MLFHAFHYFLLFRIPCISYLLVFCVPCTSTVRGLWPSVLCTSCCELFRARWVFQALHITCPSAFHALPVRCTSLFRAFDQFVHVSIPCISYFRLFRVPSISYTLLLEFQAPHIPSTSYSMRFGIRHFTASYSVLFCSAYQSSFLDSFTSYSVLFTVLWYSVTFDIPCSPLFRDPQCTWCVPANKTVNSTVFLSVMYWTWTGVQRPCDGLWNPSKWHGHAMTSQSMVPSSASSRARKFMTRNGLHTQNTTVLLSENAIPLNTASEIQCSTTYWEKHH